jgi:hypothetical protein
MSLKAVINAPIRECGEFYSNLELFWGDITAECGVFSCQLTSKRENE